MARYESKVLYLGLEGNFPEGRPCSNNGVYLGKDASGCHLILIFSHEMDDKGVRVENPMGIISVARIDRTSVVYEYLENVPVNYAVGIDYAGKPGSEVFNVAVARLAPGLTFEDLARAIDDVRLIS